MNFSDYADKATNDVLAALRLDNEAAERATVKKAIQDAIVMAVLQCEQRHSDAAHAVCTGGHTDIAHKLADEIKRSSKALVANLESMR